ncbi:MAG: glycosyltransferase, partial [Planctomycetota bacterium]
MRILHISTRLILGGSQENTVLSCEGQADLGHDVHLAFGPIYGPEGSMLDRVRAFATENGRTIATHEVPDLVREVSPLRDRRCLAQLDALIRDIQPDIVHTHSSKAGVLGRLAAWRVWKSNPARTPAVIHTIHGPPFMPVEGSPIGRAKVRTKNLIYTLAERRAARACHRIVSVADAMTEQFLARGIGTPDLYTTVRSGMDTSPYLAPEPTREAVRAELSIDESDFVIGTVARLAQHKGHDDLLDALSMLSIDWRFVHIGGGDLSDGLSGRADDLGLSDRITWMGKCAQTEVIDQMRHADVFVLPSKIADDGDRDGLPNVLMEAASQKLPL